MGSVTRFHVADPKAALEEMFGALLPGDMVYVGIDPGKEGSIAFVPTNRKIEPVILDMPLIKSKVKTHKKGKTVDSTRTEFAYAELAEWLQPAIAANERVTFALERGQPMNKGGGPCCPCCKRSRAESAKTGFAVGLGYGMWQLCFSVCGFAYQEFMPAVWKKAAGLSGKSKDVSRQLAAQRLPQARKYFTAKSDHNRAEAALLAVHLMSKEAA